MKTDLTLKVIQGLVGIVSSVISPAYRRNLDSTSQPSGHLSRCWEKPKARADEELRPKIPFFIYTNLRYDSVVSPTE